MSSSSGVSCDTSFETDDFSDVSFFIIDDVPEPPSPQPTNDIEEQFEEIDESLFILHSEHSSRPESPERPDTSTSSFFSFADDRDISHSPISLPSFVLPENSWFFEGRSVSDDLSSRRRFERWIEECMPSGDTYAKVSAAERLNNPRPMRSVPEIPSLFKKRDVGCGYCRSVGHRNSEGHTRQNCRQLFQLAPCKICGAAGVMNHTETYCPEKPAVSLEFSPEFLESFEKHRPTREFCFYNKYTTLIDAIYGRSF